MLPSLSSLTLAPDGSCRPCGPRRAAATGVVYGTDGWQLEPCPICLDPLGEDSEANPWAPNPAPYAGPCCVNNHAYHKGCIQELVNRDPSARCPECRDSILPGFLSLPGTFASRAALKAAVNELLALDPTGATPHPVHGPIGGWDVSRVSDMSALFRDATSFNQPLNSWVVSKVKKMNGMFIRATSFNQPLNSWVVSNVESMSGMFYKATSFNQPLDSWDVRNVSYMDSMFQGATSFNQDLCGWELEAGVLTGGMFANATAFNNDPTTRPPNCPGIFVGRRKLKTAVTELLAVDPTGATPHPVHGPIGGWDVSRVRDMTALFQYATEFNQPLNEWKVNNVEDMWSMFRGATAFNQPLNSWNVSNVKKMNGMFRGATAFNQPLNSWDVGNVENMENMFVNATSFNQPLNEWKVSKVEDMESMFFNATSFNQPLNSWDVRNVKDMWSMFYKATSFNQPLNGWDVSKVEDMAAMFSNATSFNQDLCGWDLKGGVLTNYMFENAIAFNRDPATRPPRKMNEANAGRDCPPLPRGLTRQRSERDDERDARQRTATAVIHPLKVHIWS